MPLEDLKTGRDSWKTEHGLEVDSGITKSASIRNFSGTCCHLNLAEVSRACDNENCIDIHNVHLDSKLPDESDG